MKIIPLVEMKSKLNDVSTSFCLAKWLQTTTTLSNGMTHSCHHPGQHHIDPIEVQKNHLALHNTPIKIAARHDLLNNIQTPECDYCWKVENMNKDNLFSDRVRKSNETWAAPHFQDVLDSGLGENIFPTYLEISFENTCNFACYYCLPEISSRIQGEIEAKGPYILSDRHHLTVEHLHAKGAYPIHKDEYNPYIEAFWKWWPELKMKLETFRITGGEPLLSPNTWKIIDDLIAEPKPNLTFAINTNLGVPNKLINKFINKLEQLSKSVKSLEIYTSAEAFGKQQEYIRYGMKWEVFDRNVNEICRKIKHLDNTKFIIMTTVNILSITSFHYFLNFVINLKAQYSNSKPDKIALSINFLRHPEFGCLTNLNIRRKELVADIWGHYLNNRMLNSTELNQLERLIEFMMSYEQVEADVKNFRYFFNEYDKRKGLSFNETFPELADL